MIPESIQALTASIDAALAAMQGAADAETVALRELQVRARKLAVAWERPQSLGLFGPSQAGKSFLVGALLANELGTLSVLSRGRELDFLKEINPAKGVESTGVVTRFTTRASAPLKKGDFACTLLGLDSVLESLATGFLVECTSPSLDSAKVDAALRDAKLQQGPPAPPVFRAAWDATWLALTKKYQDRHPYLNDLRRHPTLERSDWKDAITTPAGWMLVYALLWGGPGYAGDLDALLQRLVAALDLVQHATNVEVALDHVRATSEGASVIDAACLNALGAGRGVITVHAPDLSGPGERPRDVAIEPGALSALIAEIRLPLKPVPGSLLDRADLLDFPGGRALKGINGFGPQELNTRRLDNAIEVYKRGKLTFLFERYTLDREITALLLCSPGPTKPEAVQLQTQVESWLRIRHGGAVPPSEAERPTLFLALTKFDMSLGALRSDNAKDRWESRIQEACVDFWAKSNASWITNYGAKGQPFTNTFWIRNPYADQMRTLRPGDADYEKVKQGFFAARAVEKHMSEAAVKWAAVEGDDASGLPQSGVALLAQRLRERLAEDIKAKELRAEAAQIRAELLAWLRAMTPSRDEAEARERLLANAKALATALKAEMSRTASGAVFGAFMQRIIVDEAALEAEVRKAWSVVAPMSLKASDKVKRLLVHVLKWWKDQAAARLADGGIAVPQTIALDFVRQVVTSKKLMPVLGTAVFPYFSRTTLDTALLARILHVKVADALVNLGDERPRATPAIPVRLSFAEVIDTPEQAQAIDWENVDFSDEPAPDGAAPPSLDIVFAGGGLFRHWVTRLPEFYVQQAGGPAVLGSDDPRLARLVEVLRQVDASHALG